MSQETTRPTSVENNSHSVADNNYSNGYVARAMPAADSDSVSLEDEVAKQPLAGLAIATDPAAHTEVLASDETAAQEAAYTPNVVDENTEAEVAVPAAKIKPRKSFWREVLETIILTVLIFFLVKSLVQNFRIQGTSMEPNFHTDQYILVNKVAYFHVDVNAFLRIIPGVKADGVHNVWLFGGPHRGDVIVFQYPKAPTDDYIKRVIAFPGERVSVHQNIAYINGKALAESYIKKEDALGYLSEFPETTVPPDNLFVMGDNRNGSSDSRSWGFLPVDNIIGKAWFDYWPLFKSGWGFVPEVHTQFATP